MPTAEALAQELASREEPVAAPAPAITATPAAPGSGMSAGSVLALQRSVGNAAVSNYMIGRCAADGTCHCDKCATKQRVEGQKDEELEDPEAKLAQGVAGKSEDIFGGGGGAEAAGGAGGGAETAGGAGASGPAGAVGEAGAAPAMSDAASPAPASAGAAPAMSDAASPAPASAGAAPAMSDAASPAPADASADPAGGTLADDVAQVAQLTGVQAQDSVLAQALAATAHSRRLARTATWAAGAVHEANNLANVVMNGGPAGITLMLLNGTFASNSAVSRGLMQKPTVKTTAVAAGGFDAEIDTIPTNTGSFDETVLAPGPWTVATTKAAVAAAHPSLTSCTGGAASTFRAKGSPSDAAMYAANRRHEDHHANDHHTVFTNTIAAWDRRVTTAKAAARKFHGATEAAAEAALWAAMGGTPDQMADAYTNGCYAAGGAFHGTPRGGPVGGPNNPQSNADCTQSSAEYTNPS